MVSLTPSQKGEAKMGKRLIGAALLLAVPTAILLAATPALASGEVLEIISSQANFVPSASAQIQVKTKGHARVLVSCQNSALYPVSGYGKIIDGALVFDIKKPEVEGSLSFSVTLPATPGERLFLNVTGISATIGVEPTRKIFFVSTQKRQDVVASSATSKVIAPPPPAVNQTPPTQLSRSLSPQVAPVSDNGGLFGKLRGQVSAAWLHEFDPYKDSAGNSLGYPRSFTDVDGSLMTQLADSQWDFGLAGGWYRSPSLISKNQELLGSFGRSFTRAGPVLRFRSDEYNRTTLETMLGVNSGEQINGTNYYSLSTRWGQKIDNSLFRALGLIEATGSVFPKRYTLQNTVRGTFNGALDSWSIQEQLDIPLPVFDANGTVSSLALSVGGTWNAIWDKGKKLPEDFRSSVDVYPWIGISCRFGPNNQSEITAAGVKGDDYKGGGETPIGLFTKGTITLEGNNREIKKINMSNLTDEKPVKMEEVVVTEEE
jgi:hypothetical protein